MLIYAQKMHGKQPYHYASEGKVMIQCKEVSEAGVTRTRPITGGLCGAGGTETAGRLL